VLAVVDEATRGSPALLVARRLSSERVADVVEQIVVMRGVPTSFSVDHGTEFTSEALGA
jgi:putative transposase